MYQMWCITSVIFVNQCTFCPLQNSVLFLACNCLQFCTYIKLLFSFYKFITIQKKMRKWKAQNYSKCEFNAQWGENEFWFITSPSGRLLCSICENIFSNNRRYDLNRHEKTQHETEIVGKLKLLCRFDLQKEYLIEKKEGIKRW